MSNLKEKKPSAKKNLSTNQDENAPRRRGRPRKEDAQAGENAKPTAPKQKVEAKIAKEPKPTANNKPKNPQKQNVAQEKSENAINQAKPAPAKRGRKPKSENIVNDNIHKTEKNISHESQLSAENKPKRGRPAKSQNVKENTKQEVQKNYNEYQDDSVSPTLNPMANRNSLPRERQGYSRKGRPNSRFNSRPNPQMHGNTAEYAEDNSYDQYAQPRQLNKNPRQAKGRNLKQRPTNRPPSPHASAFDNSSIIAAITGQQFEYEDNNFQSYSADIEDNAYLAQEKQSRYGNASKKAPQGRGNRASARSNKYAKSTTDAEYDENHSLVSQIKSQNPPLSPFELMSADQQLSLPKGGEFSPQYLPQAYSEESTDLVPVQGRNKKHEKALKTEKIDMKKYSPNLKMYIAVQPDEQTEIALTDNKTIVEYFVEMAHQAKIRGNIYKGVVHNVDPNLQAAFINFGGAKNGFLQIDEVHPEYYLSPHVSNKSHKYPLISKVLRPGQEVMVQIVKEPTGSKGAFLTTWISLAGRYLVLTPGQEQIGISRKVSDAGQRAHLRELLEGIDPGANMGVIIRTAAVGVSHESIQEDLEKLLELWADIVEKASTASPHTLIHQEVDLPQRVVRDYMNEDVKEIWTDDADMATSMNRLTKELYPKKRKVTKVHTDPRQSLWERFNLQDQIDEITSREVELPSGGRVVFDQTEALMAIDINSGKTNSRASFHTMVLQTNIEAAQAIARHLRLRDIGGQIVIDFIELKDRAAVREVEKAFREAMLPDRARYEIGNMSSFGLLEIVRQRIGSSAISISSEPCPHCNGTGVRRNMEWQAQDALKEIARKARNEKSLKYVYTTDKELALYLLNTKRDRLIEIESQTNKHIEIIV